jgi:hypothetical protein
VLKRFILFTLFFSFVFFSVYLLVLAEEGSKTNDQEIKIEAKKIDYILPYPGILPDHPLYFVKVVRDKFIDFFTRDYLKKAQLYLLYSDKKTNMAIQLTKKGKWALMITTISKGEKYTLKLIELLETSKKQGVSPNNNFVLKCKLSNEKHREVIENLLKDTPQGERKNIEEVLNLNRQIKEKLNKL